MERLMQDVRCGVRVLRKSPGFTAMAVLTLALGIVGTTLVFNAYDATAWRPLPAKDPEKLTILQRRLLKGGNRAQFSLADYQNIREHSRTFSGVAAEDGYDTVLAQLPDLATGKFAEPRQALIKLVSNNYFDVLVGAGAGRVFRSADRDTAPVAVLSHASWQRRFREDPRVLGQTILVYGAAVTIVGIAPKEFVGSGNPPVPPDLWVPLSAETVIMPQRAAGNEQEESLRLVGRLKPGVTLAQAESELTALALQDEKDRGLEPVTASMVGGPAVYFIDPDATPQYRALAGLLMASFSIVLLVACANMANFFMARAAARRREMAVRTALGASRIRLVRQLMTEGVLLGLAGGAVAVLAGTWICDLIWIEVEQRIIARFTDLYYFAFTFTPDWRVLAATCVVSVLAGALLSLAGALQSSRVDLNGVLKGCELTIASGSRLRLNMRDLLIALQVTLSVVLLVSAALLTRGMVRGQSAEPGFDTHNVLNMEFGGLDSIGYDGKRIDELRQKLRARLMLIPGVSAVAFASHVPLLGSGIGQADAGRPGEPPIQALDNDVSPGFFAALGIPMVRGRDFTEREVAQRAGVVIVSQATARNLWPGEEAVGKLIQVGNPRRSLQVIGVAQDVRIVNLAQVEPYFFYLPIAPDAPLDDVFLRTSGDASQALAPGLRATSEIDTRLPSLANAHTMDDALWFQQLPSTLSTLFAAVVGSMALFLASVGIYGTIAHAVAQRTREIGIRMALGAHTVSILRLVLGRTMALVGGGACLGLAAALAVSRAITAIPFALGHLLLFGVSPRDPLAFGGVGAFLLVVALGAAYWPARRATRVDPMVALRYE
ncbi:MAG TPA: ABC transporter permease [Candidatus Sulfotelmatobacter sp.]|nr:ABC transporter permease [Candidatus Sulfotelmatobacter sp.]